MRFAELPWSSLAYLFQLYDRLLLESGGGGGGGGGGVDGGGGAGGEREGRGGGGGGAVLFTPQGTPRWFSSSGSLL
eukprot:COSAG03_NODE_1941_length_3322_cov_27.796773_6_plen_75_part_01